jgi:predicted HTH transcriptional regulator
MNRPQYDTLAIFEAITNAVAHRDYSIPGSKVRLRLFDDRLELFSPGMLPNTMTPESLPLRQVCRNELIASLLARCPVDADAGVSHRRFIMDRRGEGVPLILSKTQELSGALPLYRLIDNSELLLTIPSAL